MAESKIAKILVPIDFTPASDAALDYALGVADETGAEVEVLHVWLPSLAIFADTAQGEAMEQRLSAAASDHAARVSGRLEFGDEPSLVILSILEREPFDLVVMGTSDRFAGAACGHVSSHVRTCAKCAFVALPAVSSRS